MPILDCGTLTVDCIDEGSGPSVVLLHSSVSGNRQWRRLIEALKSDFHCIAPNLLGYGQSSRWDAHRTQTLSDATSVALAVCERIPGPVRLVGHSWGGTIALATASQLGAKVTHLALYEPMLIGLLRGHGREAAWQEAEGMYHSVQDHAARAQWDALAEIFTDYFNGDGSWASTPEDRRKTIASQLHPNPHEWDAGSPAITAEEFKAISAKTLLMLGQHTRFAIREISEVLAAAFPAWIRREIAGAGHMGPLTHGPQVNALLADFLSDAAVMG